MVKELVQPIVWRADFATGVSIIDDQHRVLINMLNEASAKLTDHSPLDDWGRVVQGLLSYAGYHFQTEERLMTEYGYDQDRAALAAEHVRQHQDFAGKVVAASDRIKAGQRIPKAELVAFLTSWLSNHILHTDKEFGAFVRDRQARAGISKA